MTAKPSSIRIKPPKTISILGAKLAELGISGSGVAVGIIGVLVGSTVLVGERTAEGVPAAKTCSPLLNMEKERVNVFFFPD
jgi:hypothetical protein